MAAPSLEEAVSDFVKGNDDSTVQTTVNELLDDKLKLIDIVEHLGPHLTSVENVTRCRGTQFLAEIVHTVPYDQFNAKEVDLLSNFFCDRLKDHHSVIPHVLYALETLSSVECLSDEAALKICQCVNKDIHVQSLPQRDRGLYYHLIDNFLNHHLTALQPLGPEFVYAFIQSMDGEMDPRNLTLVFNVVPKIIDSFSIGAYVEELFEVTSCYFPINFTPPPNDPYGIKSEDLVLALRRCLAASPKFTEFCLPLLIEKMSSDIMAAKEDAFLTLCACAGPYGFSGLKEYISSLWACIKQEVLARLSETVTEAALSGLTAIVGEMSKALTNTSGQHDPLDDYLHEIFQDCKQLLCGSDNQLTPPTGHLLQSVASASDKVCANVINFAVPILLEQFENTTLILQKRNLIDVILQLIKISKSFTYFEPGVNPVLAFKDQLLVLFYSLLEHQAYMLRCSALSGLTGIASLQGSEGEATPDDEMLNMLNKFLHLCLHDTESNVRTEAMTAISFCSNQFPDLVIQHTLPVVLKLFANFPAAMEIESAPTQVEPDYKLLLDVLASVSLKLKIIQQTVPIILEDFEKKSCHSVKEEKMFQESEFCLKCLHNIINVTCDNEQNVAFYNQRLVKKLLQCAVRQSVKSYEIDNEIIILDTKTLQSIGRIFRVITCSSSTQNAIEAVSWVSNVCLGQEKSLFGLENKFHPLEISSRTRQTCLIMILSSILVSAPKQVVIPEVKDLLDKLMTMAIECSDHATRLASAKCAAGIINKMQLGGNLDSIIDEYYQKLLAVIKNDLRGNALLVWSWIAKALVIRSHKMAPQFTDLLLLFLEDKNLARQAADSFYIIMNEFEDVMTPAQHANIKILYRQRIFIQTSGRLVEAFNKTKPEQKQFYLTALSYLLRFLPKQILSTELPLLLPMLIQSLQQDEIGLQLSTMNTLYDMIHDSPKLLCQYLDSLMPQLLMLSKYKPSMNVRMAAVQCLGVMSTLPRVSIMPYYKTVTLGLIPGLDDHKRLVRKEVVKARNEWFLLETIDATS